MNLTNKHRTNIHLCLSSQELKCNGSVKECGHILELSFLMKEYFSTNDSHDEIKSKYNSVSILNSMNHLLFNHESDLDFEYVFNLFGGWCDLTKCDLIRRYYNNDMESRPSFLSELFDKMHCYYQHSYHIFRLTQKEKQNII